MTDRKNLLPAITTEIEGSKLTLTFASGAKLIIDADTLSQPIRQHALMHGLKQKLVDAAAISRDPETGRTASPMVKEDAVRAVAARLLAGEWNKSRADGDGAGSGSGGLLVRALYRYFGGAKPIDAIREAAGKYTKAEQAALRATPKIAAIIEQIKAEEARDADNGGEDTGAGLLDRLVDL